MIKNSYKRLLKLILIIEILKNTVGTFLREYLTVALDYLRMMPKIAQIRGKEAD